MRRSEEERARLIEQQSLSGKSIVQFCREHGIDKKSFYQWRARCEPEKFVRINGSSRIELELSNGAVIKVSKEDLKSVLAAIG